MIYLADKSALARVRTSDLVAGALYPLFRTQVIATCPVIDLEVFYSARDQGHYERLLKAQRQLIVLPMTPEVHDRALEVQQVLIAKSQHRGIGPADLLIAACAEVHGATVLHYDRDFDVIAEVTGQPALWVAPPGSIP